MTSSLIPIMITDESTDIDPGFSIHFTDTTNNNVDLKLPVITADGQHFTIRNVTESSSFITTVTAHETNTIEKQSSYTVPSNSSIQIVSLDANWYIILNFV